MPYVRSEKLRRMWDDRQHGPQATVDLVESLLAAGRRGEPGGLRATEFSIREMFEDLVPDGREHLRAMEGRSRRGSATVLEDVSAVDTTAFSAIFGQLAVSEILRGYEAPEFIWPKLVRTVDTKLIYGQKIPGISGIGDVAEVVPEGRDYPIVGVNQEYIETQALEKRGFEVPVTEEAVVSDNTGLLLERCNKTAQFLGVNKEKRAIDLATGITNNYKRNGTSTNTYLTSGAYTNSLASNPLSNEWKAIEAALLLFDGLSDPNTGEPIFVNADTMLVPTQLMLTANRIRNATEVQTVDLTATTQTIRTNGGNPIANKIANVLYSPYVKRRTNNTTRWWFGDFQRAFACMTLWNIESDQLGRDSHWGFHRDVIYTFKGRLMDRMQVLEPRAVTQNN